MAALRDIPLPDMQAKIKLFQVASRNQLVEGSHYSTVDVLIIAVTGDKKKVERCDGVSPGADLDLLCS